MDKKTFKRIIGSEEDIIDKLYEEINNAYMGRYVISGVFYTPDIWSSVEEMNILKEPNGFLNLFDEERRLFVSDVNQIPEEIMLVNIINSFPKKELKHKDYMGALMSLGINREKFSDLVVKEDRCYFLTFKILRDYIENNFKKAGKNSLKIEFSDVKSYKELQDIKKEEEELLLLLPSLRIDSLISEITGKSRKDSSLMVERGEVLINYKISKNKSQDLKTDDIITIRGYGKYRIFEEAGKTKKDKIKLIVKKY